MATRTQRLAQQLTGLRAELHAAMQEADARTVLPFGHPDDHQFHRGQSAAYLDAVTRLDSVLADEVVVVLVPTDEGPQ